MSTVRGIPVHIQNLQECRGFSGLITYVCHSCVSMNDVLIELYLHRERHSQVGLMVKTTWVLQRGKKTNESLCLFYRSAVKYFKTMETSIYSVGMLNEEGFRFL